jgi:hypothetical protein
MKRDAASIQLESTIVSDLIWDCDSISNRRNSSLPELGRQSQIFKWRIRESWTNGFWAHGLRVAFRSSPGVSFAPLQLSLLRGYAPLTLFASLLYCVRGLYCLLACWERGGGDSFFTLTLSAPLVERELDPWVLPVAERKLADYGIETLTWKVWSLTADLLYSSWGDISTPTLLLLWLLSVALWAVIELKAGSVRKSMSTVRNREMI